VRLRDAFLYGASGASLYTLGFWLYDAGVPAFIDVLVSTAGAAVLLYGGHKVVEAEKHAAAKA